jgi:hypothetical protein
MSEPIEESVEVSFIEWLNRFEEHIWPLFKDRGYSKGDALIMWHLNRVENRIEDLMAERL